jgi:hypothetical protein
MKLLYTRPTIASDVFFSALPESVNFEQFTKFTALMMMKMGFALEEIHRMSGSVFLIAEMK